MSQRPHIINIFAKGLNRDLNGYVRPRDTYYDALNAVNASKDGDMLALNNEAGNINYVTIASSIRPSDKYHVIGKTVINNDLVLFSVDSTETYSEIGVVDTSGTYTSISNSDEYGFTLDHQIQAVGRVLFNNHRVVYWIDDNVVPRYLDLDDPFTSNINDQSSLIQNQTLAYVDFVGTQEGGGDLPAGIVQYSVRYLNKNLDPQTFGFLCNPIPIVNENRSQGRNAYDGAVFDTATTKALNLEIKNIDTNFDYLEIAVVYYSGATNDLQVRLLARKNITGTTMQFTHTSMSETLEELTIDDISEGPINYDTAKCIAQKDGMLLLSNLRATTDSYNFQSIANDINVSYVINEVEHKDDSTYFGDYKDEALTFSQKSLLRGEVYSFAVGFKFKNGVTSLSYHIPGDHLVDTAATVTGATTGDCGTFVSTIDYPTGMGYPSGKVRHHRMPTLQQQPHFRYDSTTNRTYIRILGVEFSNIVLPSDIIDKIDSYFIVREQRNTPSKRSIVAQGIAQNLMLTHNSYNFGDGQPNGSVDPVWKLTPLFGDTPITQTDVGWAAGVLTVPTTYMTGLNESTVDNTYVGFLGPDFVINQIDPTEASYIEPTLSIKGSVSLVDIRKTQYEFDNDLIIKFYNPYKPFRAYAFCAYGQNPVALAVPRVALSPSDAFLASAGAILNDSIFGSGNDLDNTTGTDFAFLKANAPLPKPTLAGDEQSFIDLKAPEEGDAPVLGPTEKETYDSEDSYSFINNRRYLYNLTKDNPTQYGSIDQAQYIMVKHSKELTNPLDTTITCYNGDTFITKFGVYNKQNYNCRYAALRVNAGVPDTRWEYPIAAGWDGLPLDGLDLRALSYFFVESSINCNYRHKETTTAEYYPHANTFPVLDMYPSIGNTSAYNKTYSMENSAIKYNPKAIGFVSVSDYQTRTIYSQQAIEGEQSDSYRIFGVNNYHDLPKHSGEIWSTFVYNNGFYMRTINSLWQGFLNERTAVGSSAGDILVAPGGIFDRPSQEIFTIDGGYVGTQSQWADVTTPFGRFLLDAKQGKCFLFNGKLTDLSEQGMWNWFAENLKLSSFDDNPANPTGKGFHSVYDGRYKRILLTKRDGNNSWTISYSFISNAWVSFHSYKPHFYVGQGQEFFSIMNDDSNPQVRMWKHNVGNYGSFYGTVYPFTVEFSPNEHKEVEKAFDNFEVHCKSTNALGITFPRDTFNLLQVYTDTQNTGSVTLTMSNPESTFDNCKLKKTHYQIAIPNDNVIDRTQNIFDPGNLGSTELFKPRIKSKFINVKLTYNNTNNYKFSLREVITYFRPIAR